MNAEACFEGQDSLTLGGLENALNSSVRNRKTIERADFVNKRKDSERPNVSSTTSQILSSSSFSSATTFDLDADYDDNSSSYSPIPGSGSGPVPVPKFESESGNDIDDSNCYSNLPSQDTMNTADLSLESMCNGEYFSDDRGIDHDCADAEIPPGGQSDRTRRSEKRRKGIASGFKNSVFRRRIGVKGLGVNYEAAGHFFGDLLTSLGYVEVKEGVEQWKGQEEGTEMILEGTTGGCI